MAFRVEETKNQTESQHIKSNIGFSWEGKTRVPGEKPLLKIRVEKQQSQPTKIIIMTMGQEIDPRPYWWKALVLSPMRQLHYKNDDKNDNDSNNKQ